MRATDAPGVVSPGEFGADEQFLRCVRVGTGPVELTQGLAPPRRREVAQFRRVEKFDALEFPTLKLGQRRGGGGDLGRKPAIGGQFVLSNKIHGTTPVWLVEISLNVSSAIESVEALVYLARKNKKGTVTPRNGVAL